LDTVQIQDKDTGEYLSIDEVCAQYKDHRKQPGAPGIYDLKFHPRAAFLLCAEHGAEMNQLSMHFGVSFNTVRAWMWRYPLFADAVRNGWTVHMVKTAERALVQRAVGFSYEEVKRQRVPRYETVFNDKGTPHKVIVGYEEVVVERVTKQVAPDSTALMFLLQNRDGTRWRNVRKVEQTHKMEYSIPGQETAKTPEKALLELDTATLEKVAEAARLFNVEHSVKKG
jgi:hypothetical protein